MGMGQYLGTIMRVTCVRLRLQQFLQSSRGSIIEGEYIDGYNTISVRMKEFPWYFHVGSPTQKC